MQTDPVIKPGSSKAAIHRIEDNPHLSPEEKAYLSGVVNGFEKKLVKLSTQLAQLQQAAETSNASIEKTLVELEDKKQEIEIEAALEEVRSRSLAMREGDELYEVVSLVLKKLQDLGIAMQESSAYIIVFNEGKKELIEWAATPEHPSSLQITIPYIDHPILNSVWEAREEGAKFIAKTFSVEEKNDYFRYYFDHVCCDHQLDHLKDIVFESNFYGYSIAVEKNSAIGISSFKERTLSARESQILKRFVRVFEQAYIRFLDLQKFNAQARAALIEAALERVRSRAMAMQNSHDISNAIGLLFTELEKLGIVTLRCGIFIIEEPTKMMDVWTAVSTSEGKVGKAGGRFSMIIHPMLEQAFKAWQQNDSFYTYELAGEELKEYFKILLAHNPGYSLPAQNLTVERQVSSGFFFKEGALFTFTTEPHPPETIAVLQRFAAVFGLTHRRYLDLKKSEEQNKQLIKQASIDKLRAEIASMRTPDDLYRITPLVWSELKTLHVPFVRCGVFIVDSYEGFVHAYLSTPEGQPRGVVHMPINEREHIRKLVDHWRRGAVYTEYWQKEEFMAWMAYLNTLKPVSDTASYLRQTNVPDVLHLHFAPFAQGMLYVGNAEPLTAEEIQAVEALAKAFAIAYARYEDFKKLEEAKNKVETTLHELQTAQRQLIHSEKMASLGEITAGVAHEIQNPLNFVNNFSETTVDLFKELEEAIQGGRSEEAAVIIGEIKQSLERITHHGKRADSIVKSMLQHSRKNSDQRMPTDINALVDEYLQLSYHGFRRKDKLFNVAIQTRYDERIGKIEVISQDIARVLLNLFNNAFYAVNERKKEGDSNYQPTIRILTRLDDDKIKIRVKDNGMGIPQKTIAKIFQPFFTTKPPGSGTGLGLSLSYDIVKMHGGELKVRSIEGEETEFTVVLNYA